MLYLLKTILMSNLKFVIPLIFVFSGINSNKKIDQSELKSGDLLLISASNKGISKAIDRVTKQDSTTHYSHIAMIEKTKNKCWVLHAGTKNGSERITLENFLGNREKGGQIDVYRLKKKYINLVPQAIKTAKKWLGKPYNYSYILSNEKLYCSDFIQRAFASDSVFGLEPMTFVNPKTGRTDTVWTNYYKKMNLAVPEGKLGCNPNGIASSDKIYFVGHLK